MTTAVANPRASALPAHLQGKVKENRIGNIDRSDLIIPRVKLLQAISPEVETFEAAKSGTFWHTVLNESLGKELVGIPIIMRKTFVLWSPRGDDRGVLARARDAIHWDPPNMEFTVKPKNSPKPVTWRTANTVAESGLDKFGSSIPDDPDSQPAAALTYEFLWLFPDFLDLGPAIILNTRSGVKPAKKLLSTIDAKPVDHYYTQYKISVVQEKGAEGPYNNYNYVSDGYASEELGEQARKLYEAYKDAEFRASDEDEDTASGAAEGAASGGGAGKKERDTTSKF